MISIVKYLLLEKYVDTSDQGLLTHAAKSITGLHTDHDLKQMDDDRKFQLAQQARKHTAEMAKQKEVSRPGAAALSDETTGVEAAGHALKKGAHAAGEAAGSLGKHAADFAGANPGTAGLIAGGLGTAAWLAAKRKRAQA